jgi:hypothetical protein
MKYPKHVLLKGDNGIKVENIFGSESPALAGFILSSRNINRIRANWQLVLLKGSGYRSLYVLLITY